VCSSGVFGNSIHHKTPLSFHGRRPLESKNKISSLFQYQHFSFYLFVFFGKRTHGVQYFRSRYSIGRIAATARKNGSPAQKWVPSKQAQGSQAQGSQAQGSHPLLALRQPWCKFWCKFWCKDTLCTKKTAPTQKTAPETLTIFATARNCCSCTLENRLKNHS
jgi:hypothetical protein